MALCLHECCACWNPTRMLLQGSPNVPILLWVQCARSIASHAGKFVPSCYQWHCHHQAACPKSRHHNMPPQDLAQEQLDHPQNHEPLHAGQAWKSLARPPWAMNPCILGLLRNPLNLKISSFDRSISSMGVLLCQQLPGCLPPKGVPIQKLSDVVSIEMDPEVNPKIHRCSIAELVKAEMAVWQHNEPLQLLKPPLCDVIKSEFCQRVLWLLAPRELAKRIWHLLGLLETCVCRLLVFLLLALPSYVHKLSFHIQLVS